MFPHLSRARLLASTAILRMMPDVAGSGDSPSSAAAAPPDPASPASSPTPAGDAATPGPTGLSVIDAVNSLSPDNDANWTADGLPDVDVIESLTGNKWISRGDIEGVPITRDSQRQRWAANQVIAAVNAPDEPPATAPTVQVIDDPTVQVDVEGGPAAAPPVVPTDTAPVGGPPTEPASPATPDTSGAPTPAPAPDPNTAASLTVVPSGGQKISVVRLVMAYFGAGVTFDGHDSAGAIVVAVNDDGSVNLKAFNPSGGADNFYTGVRNRNDVNAMPDGVDKNAALACTWDWPPRV